MAKPSGKPAATPSRRPSAHPASIPSGASDPSGWVEVLVRRSLSLDGRTLTLTPETALAPGTLYRAVAQGLASLSGETAPAFTRHFKTQPRAQLADVDLTRIHLSYPTEAFDVTVAIPEGAVPAWSLVEVEAQLMGSHGQGVMPPSGSLAFQLKASLGERLKVTVQTRDGRTVSGLIGRYVAPDGRTTLGVDGGRVEGPQGLAIILPPGAVEEAIELKVEVPTEVPVLPAGTLLEGETAVPALRVLASRPVEFKKPPVVEVPEGALPAGVDTRSSTALAGNGPVAVFRKEVRTLPDGSTDECHILMDTAELRETPSGRKLVTLGGLRLADPAQGTVVHQQAVKLAGIVKVPEMGQHQTQARSLSSPGERTLQFGGTTGGLAGALLDLFLLGFPASSEPEYRYHSGMVYRNWNGLGRCGGSASATCYGELPLAEVYRYRGTAGLDEARKGRLARGRMLATCDEQGRYLNVGGPMAEAIPGQSWMALFAVDPRTGETSIDPGAVPAASLGLPFERRNHSIAITSTGGNPFDPSLTAPRLRAQLVDGDGLARTMFGVGERASLRIFTEPGSQAVVRGKVSGALTQDFGALPAELPVSFSQEGTWKVDILGWTAKPVEGRSSLSVVVTPAGALGPSLPGKPTILTKEPGERDKDIDPSAIVKITFSEPVRMATVSSFRLKSNGADLPFQVVSNGREVEADDTWVQMVWLVPAQRLSLGASVAVEALSFLVDRDGEHLEAVSWTFTVRGADEVGALAGIGTLSELVAHKGMLYAVEDLGPYGTLYRKSAIRVIDVTDPSRPVQKGIFGEHGSWDPKGYAYSTWSPSWHPFFKHGINGLRVAAGVGINGQSRDLLLVLSRPHQTTEPYVWENGVATDFRSRHNTVWVFDITGDAASTGPEGEPKLLMCSSLGTLPENWGKGLGSAGGVLGAIRRQGGLTLWDGDRWFNGYVADAQALEAAGGVWNGVQVQAWRARYTQGYYPGPGTVVASNGFYNPAAGVKPTVTSGVIAEDAEGRPIAFATMGYTQGMLAFIEGKVGEPMAMATYNAGGPEGLDSRVHDLGFAVNREPAHLVEVLKGTWQGTKGTEQGTLLLVGTQTGTANYFWVLKPDLSNPNNPGVTQLAKAELPGRITRITTDPQKMLVGVQAGQRVYVFDLKTLRSTSSGPMTLTPIYECAAEGGWTLDQGMLLQSEGTAIRRLVVKNLDGVTITPKLGIPLLVDANQFFAGAFYDYNRSVLGDYNPPPQPQMPEKLVYALTDMQGKNGGYPMLRHHYPDLGEMHISGVVNLQDPKQFLEATRDDSPWFMEAEAKLFDGNAEVPGAVTIEALTISEDQRKVTGNGTRRSKVFGNGLMARAELSASRYADGLAPTAPWQEKFAYAPFKFFVRPEVLTRLDQEMRLDFKERFRIQVQMKLYKDERQRALGNPEATLKTYEFAVKFNSNTRLFDVLRGGVWYFDPVVASEDPSDTAQNPFTAEWLKRLVDAKGEPVDFGGIFKTRLSVTPGVVARKGTKFNDIEFSDDVVSYGENSFAWMGLDIVQQLLENAIPKLRRQVFEGDRPTRMTPWFQRFRPVFQVSSPDDQGLLNPTRAADSAGAYGYRMAHVVNALQAFTHEEADANRNLNIPRTWGKDPTLRQEDKDPEGRKLESRISPVLNQHLKNGEDYNPGNILVNYLVAYPRIQKQGTRDNGLYPINTILTRDLLVGPVGISAPGFEEQRQAIDSAILEFNQAPALNGMDGAGKDAVEASANRLFAALVKQQIITDAGSMSSGAGALFNSGLGMLQLGLQEQWLPRPIDPQEPGYTPDPSKNPHMYIWVETPKNLDYDSDSGFNMEVRRGLFDFMMKHLGAKRVDLYINGVQNVPEEIEESADRLQKKVDELEVLDKEPLDSPKRTPVIAIYNASAKRYYGGNDDKDLFDGTDILRQKRDTAQPFTKTRNPDAVKLIAVLRALVEVVWSAEFSQAVMNYHLDHDRCTFEEAYQKLANLRARVTLHAHSQGAIVAAVAHSRLGSAIQVRRPEQYPWAYPDDYPAEVSVGMNYRLVTYGGGANMLDWGPNLYFRDYAHHVNQKDAIALLVGMQDPFQELLHLGAGVVRSAALLANISAAAPLIKRKSQGSCITELMNDPMNPHIDKVLSGPTFWERQTWKNGDHKVIFHESPAASPNPDEHNFVNGYVCAIDKEWLTGSYPRRTVNEADLWGLFPWVWIYENPKVVTGEGACLYQR